jgi:hypothetical protein
MGVVKKFVRWRANRGVSFVEQPNEPGIEARLDAAEYELQGILRDVARVRMPELVMPAADRLRLRQ